MLIGVSAILSPLACSDPNAAPPIKTVPVEGSVKFPDGTPLGEGSVTFVPSGEKGRQATGKLGSDGSFKLTTGGADGIAEGDYRVRVDTTRTRPGPRGKSVSVIPPQYLDEDSSGLTAAITATTTKLDPFVLDEKKRANLPKANSSRPRDRD
jgi:hypothetical protein